MGSHFPLSSLLWLKILFQRDIFLHIVPGMVNADQFLVNQQHTEDNENGRRAHRIDRPEEHVDQRGNDEKEQNAFRDRITDAQEMMACVEVPSPRQKDRKRPCLSFILELKPALRAGINARVQRRSAFRTEMMPDAKKGLRLALDLKKRQNGLELPAFLDVKKGLF